MMESIGYTGGRVKTGEDRIAKAENGISSIATVGAFLKVGS